MKKKYEAVKVETFKVRGVTKRYFVARKPNGTLEQRRPVKGSGLTLTEAKSLYKNQFSLYEHKYRNPRTNVTEVSVFTNVKAEPSREKTPNQVKNMTREQRKEYKQSLLPAYERTPVSKKGLRGQVQYVVQGYVNGKLYVGRSKKIGATASDGWVFPESANAKACKESAWKSLLQQVSKITGHYDEDEGIRIIENQGIRNVKEGWITYTSSKNRN